MVIAAVAVVEAVAVVMVIAAGVGDLLPFGKLGFGLRIVNDSS